MQTRNEFLDVLCMQNSVVYIQMKFKVGRLVQVVDFTFYPDIGFVRMKMHLIDRQCAEYSRTIDLKHQRVVQEIYPWKKELF